MRDYLAKRGVPVDNIIVDGLGLTTAATAKNAAAIVRAHHWSSISVVSQYGVVNPKTNGTEVFGLPKVPMSWQLATSSSALLSSTLGTVDRGHKTKSLFVIREATRPAILAEVAFLTNVGGDETSCTDLPHLMRPHLQFFLA